MFVVLNKQSNKLNVTNSVFKTNKNVHATVKLQLYEGINATQHCLEGSIGSKEPLIVSGQMTRGQSVYR